MIVRADRSSAHEPDHRFWNRRWLYAGGALVAGDGIAARECMVGTGDPDQLDSTRHHRPGRSDLESLARSHVDLPFERPLQRLVLGADHLFLLDVRLLLV